MLLLCLLTCLVLSAFNAQAKVDDSFDECTGFFYKDIAPQRINHNGIKICQMLGNKMFFASFYSDHHKIPLYSAYKFDNECSQEDEKSHICSHWHTEPQISYGPSDTDHMTYESSSNNVTEKYRINQGISFRYKHTGYDRGQLNPQSFHCGDGRVATFRLTNAVPMDACFIRNHWKNWENYLLRFLKGKLQRDSKTTVYIVTGAVPGDVRIPQKEDCVDSWEFERITVPSHIWTAVCYEHKDDAKSFSFGYIGRNSHEFDIKLMSTSTLKQKLGELYYKGSKTSQSVKIFEDDCFGDQRASENAISEFLNNITLPKYQEKQMSRGAQKDLLAFQNIISSNNAHENGAKITGLTATLAFNSMKTFYTSLETMKKDDRSACLLTKISARSNNHDKAMKGEGSETVECQLVPEKSVDGKTAADGSSCSNFTNNGHSCTCVTPEGKIKLCCSSPCLYQDKLKAYWCHSGETQIQCSPQYSLMANKGKRCRNDHPCATYGEDYYWCYTDSDSWQYCSPPRWGTRTKNGQFCRNDHACAKYQESYTWCYTDDGYSYCCPFDDCFSAINYHTCKPNHPCGYHGETYLWCYTTDGNWNYCCKECIWPL